MTMTEIDKLKAMAMVHIFETSRPFGDYSACVVLDDGAGVSYGINQFTHRSGSLREVVERYLATGALAGRNVLAAAMPLLKSTSRPAIDRLASDAAFKRALKAAASTPEMRTAQTAVAFERYLRPALDICRSRGFALPLSLAVVYDSVTHGSWERIAARVTPLGVIRKASKDATLTEKAWITEYVRRRHLWLTHLPRLRATNYRTRFFLGQIAIGNWELRLPLNVHGIRLTDAVLRGPSEFALCTISPSAPITPANGQPSSVGPINAGGTAAGVSLDETAATETPAPSAEKPHETDFLESAGVAVASAASKFDRVDGVISAVTARRDAAKSLWTTIVGTVWQAAWAVFGFIVGLPRSVWIVVAVIAAAFAILYLYRQIVLGKIREQTMQTRTRE
ncbi:MAG TPA: chitosanase [Pyrinomonadaceae bacterium]|nr:chitosanase [Pyrinomonadaceae bacterium]